MQAEFTYFLLFLVITAVLLLTLWRMFRAAKGTIHQLNYESRRDRAVAEAEAEPSRETDSERRQRLMQAARSAPAVRTLSSVFGAEIVDIKPLDPAPEPSQQESDT